MAKKISPAKQPFSVFKNAIRVRWPVYYKSGYMPGTMLTGRIQLSEKHLFAASCIIESQQFSRVMVMVSKTFFEQTATSIAALNRNELKRRIRNFRGRFKLDFSDDYLNTISIDRLRHILLAALINAKPHN